LLASTNEGYRNLRELSSLAFLEGYYYKRLDWDLLERYTRTHRDFGLSGGVVLQALLQDDYPRRSSWPAAPEHLGPENFFIELQDQGS